MDLQYYYTLYPAYALALLGWVWLSPKWGIEPQQASPPFDKPLQEFLLCLGAIVVCLGIGQLYVREYLLPTDNKLRFLLESLNHILIFSPFLLLLPLRKQSLASAWIPEQEAGKSLVLGLGLAFVSIALFLGIKGEVSQFFPTLAQVYHPKNLPLMVQVFLEDFAIALCFVRFQALIGERWAVLSVAVLFAAGHIPAMLEEGIEASEFLGLSLDALLVVGVMLVLIRWKNILWFWMLHYAMDMMQFLD